jgi:methionyl-tRNA formyltransferase
VPLKLIVMGTGDFAVPMFRAVLESRHNVLTLVTQPPRVSPGRREAKSSRIKQVALDRAVEVFEPEDVNAAVAVAELARRGAELYVVAAYGQILSDELLSVPRLGGINLHASLLPKYRGAAPVNWAIYHGETKTGVTVIQMQPRVDAGPMLAQANTPIGDEETAGELSERLAELGAPLVVEVIDALETGTAEPTAQDRAQATRAPRIKKSQGVIDWSRTAEEICWHVRAMQPWPTAYTFMPRAGNEPLRLIVLRCESLAPRGKARAPGTVAQAEGNELVIQTGGGLVAIRELQLAGKKAMSAAEFLRGHAPQPGDRWGEGEYASSAPSA